MNTYRYYVGIDPDVSKSGVVLLDKQQRTFTFVDALTFTETIRYLHTLDTSQTCVVIEDSDTATNWHYNSRDTKAICAAKGRSVGMCHATARHLREYAENIGLIVQLQHPLRKCWHGQDGKITHDELMFFTRGLPTRTNQEMRDAALLAWVVADLAVRVKIVNR